MATQETFPFLKLPAEIRHMVYSYIILPTHQRNTPAKAERKEESTQSQSPSQPQPGRRRFITVDKAVRNKPADQHYYQQRQLCHITAQALLLTCRLINKEATPIYFKHKTLILSKPYLEHTSILNNLRWTPVDYIRNIEFNLLAHPAGVVESAGGNNFVRNKMINMIDELREQIHRLPDIENINIKIIDTSKPSLRVLDSDFSVEVTETCLDIATMPRGVDTWCYDGFFKSLMARMLVEEMAPLWQVADGLQREILNKREWDCDKKIVKSGWRLERDFFMLDVKFQRRSDGIVSVEDEDMEGIGQEEYINMVDTSEGIMQAMIDDYDEGNAEYK